MGYDEFNDCIPARAFDNFQFVNVIEIMPKKVNPSRKEAEFALTALMEIHSQYLATVDLNLFGRCLGGGPERVPLPPPDSASVGAKAFQPSTFQPREAAYGGAYKFPLAVNMAPTSSYPYDSQLCPFCLASPKDLAFDCGHQTCSLCGEDLTPCPILTRIRLY